MNEGGPGHETSTSFAPSREQMPGIEIESPDVNSYEVHGVRREDEDFVKPSSLTITS